MKLYRVITGPLKVNSYFVVNEETNEAVLIDGGESYNKIKSIEQEYGIKVKAELLTHAHFDHAGCAKKLQDDGVKIYISKIDSPKLLNNDNLGVYFGRKFDSFTPDYTFSDGDKICILGFNFKAMITPGHTDGSACFILDDIIFTGDTLFYECVGRTDFISGNREDIINSVKKLFALPGDYKICPGHEEETTMSHERKYNIFAHF